VVPVFSTTKGLAGLAMAHAHARGLYDHDERVAKYWPEFAQEGKDAITVRQLLSHQAGLPLVEGEYTLDAALDWDTVVEQLACQAPAWEPGTKHGYHMRTFGWLVGELIRRVSGSSVGQFLRDEIATPLGLDFWIGLPEEIEPRVARLVPPKSDMRAALEPYRDKLLLARVFENPGGHFNYDEMWNTRALHACELPSSNGIGDARSLARLYAATIGDVDGVRILRDDTVATATQEQARGPDAVIMVESRFGFGFMLGASFGARNPDHVFGHAGAGGSLAFADPRAGIGFGYVMNDLRFDPKGDPRSETLVAACYESLAASAG
ncbi:MAG TPA: serine hydrolase domain-containing protein, partial [Acidimicrobiia bacterium]|nr:serine hydrolase domain-containing protein [Acidimicrobiia bacterium]